MGRPLRPTTESQRASWASPWGPPWGTRRATGTTAQHHPAGPPHPDPAQNLVKHEGFEQPTQTSACGATSQAHLELIKGRAQKKSEETARDATRTPRRARERPKNHESRWYGGHFWAPLAARKRTPKGPPRHPWGTEGAAKTAPSRNPEPLNKKRRGQEKDNKNTPQIRSPLTRVLCSCPSGSLLWRRRGTKKTHTHMHFTAASDSKGLTQR